MATTQKKRLTKEEKAKALKLAVIAELLGLANGKIKPSEGHFGICAHLEEKFDLWRLPAFYCADWPQFSGSEAYPVPSAKKGVSASRHFWRADGLWSGKYGLLRKSLCKFIAKAMEREIRKGDYKLHGAQPSHNPDTRR